MLLLVKHSRNSLRRHRRAHVPLNQALTRLDDGELNRLGGDLEAFCRRAAVSGELHLGEVAGFQVALVREVVAEVGASAVLPRQGGVGDGFGDRDLALQVQPVVPR